VEVPFALVRAVGVTVGLGVVLLLSRALATLTATNHWNTYYEGFGEGVQLGVNRALGITPEQHRENREWLNKAELARLHLDGSSRSANTKQKETP
jgi:hypothetical protein